MSSFELKRQKRRTLSVAVKQGKVTVSAPLKMPLADIERFLLEKADWINRKIAEYNRKRELFADVLDYKVVLVKGERYKTVLSDKVKRIAFAENELLLPQKYNGALNAEKAIGSFFRKTAQVKLKEMLDEATEKTGLSYNGFSLTNAKGKWGSCDGENNIMLNWRLYMLSPRLIDYVMVHELCHTVHHNHSSEFWAKVAEFYPNYKNARKELKTNSVINELFR